MKKTTIFLAVMLAFAGIVRSQIVEDFEHIPLNVMSGGENAYMHVVPNPDEVGNISTHVVEFRRGQDGDPWAGFWSELPEPLDLANHKYVYVDVWKPRISPVKFKIEGGDTDDMEVESMFEQTKVEEWETLVFDFSEKDGQWNVIAFMPDFADPVDLDEDIIIYFDNFRVGGPPEEKANKDEFDTVDFVWCDFEIEEYTNVDGFREVINDGTVAADLPGEGVSGGTVGHLEYVVEEEFPSTGYHMWAWDPDWEFDDLSEYTHLVIHAKAQEESVSDIMVELLDYANFEEDAGDPGISYGYFDLDTEWTEIVIDLEDLSLPEDEDIENHPDMSQLQLISLIFEYETTSPETGDILIDMVGFSTLEDDDNGDSDGYTVENFEHIPLNLMLGGEEDDSRMYVIPNPDMDETNQSPQVVKFERSQHGVPWGGFWSSLPEPLDLTENKYVYVDVWKPRISPVVFKVEAGDTDDMEIESMFEQTKVEEWETLVFDFSEKDGLWNVIAFMPDFADPVDLDEDIVIYFDNIRVGDEPVSAPDIALDNAFDVQVYPNPARDVVRVDAPAGSSVYLIDVTGTVIDRTEAGDGDAHFTVSGLSQGVYLIRADYKGSYVTERILVY